MAIGNLPTVDCRLSTADCRLLRYNRVFQVPKSLLQSKHFAMINESIPDFLQKITSKD
ncbi:hypothetical protein KsCSTR_41150 [Candidatus Kuenenia stuttgartiensis]|uniref:Uncharacterized protein n=1 Tax=Kuenenia stuttgartiensis TaxID=174633 RepID=Q1Q7F2_KUEST|nr:hypothetical protein KsCSTR_41150 [Candidatus Kuenenia stuttgartiensis]CAJ70756.1 unknown protein [Candidatus Kuenenia stuttgartiensis]